ncbi:DUF2791 family P-loop domain-containing protein [Clostridium sp. A1-XYC3]|uniref:DUF2791 family P-loop domain-containing protein n=1 Tax=Clostridium tanneri TaxID=3037988 RepID=A0ABU4JWC1_9CLOT|nr:BREX system ATP-binding domain-containing protein [Clostridium sp. A1-XYC3]MDW8802470.1 DUF2791 family P-loop domain-containing protein [Clostridium sp. A1-XYC3]
MDLDIKQARIIINSLKSGVVPDADLEFFCSGRYNEIKEFNRCLELTKEGGSAVKFITGTYGSGKSFLLNIVGQKALKENFVIANIKIEKNFKFNKGEEMYYQIMHNLGISNNHNKGTSFEEMFDIWVKELQKNKDSALADINNLISTINDYNSSFAIAFTSYIKAKINNDADLSNAASAWIKGEKNVSASLKSKFNVKASIDKTNYMSFFKAVIRLINLLGYSGLVILVDELELIVGERSNIREAAYENIRNIIDMSGAGEINNCMFLFTGTNELFENEEKGIKTYSALYKRIVSSYDNENLQFKDLRRSVIKIKGLGKEELVQLTKNIISIHSMVYKWNPQIEDETITKYAEISCSRFGNKITESNTREYSKKVVDALDIMEQNPGVDIFKNEVEVSGELVVRSKTKEETSTILDTIIEDSFFDNDIIKFD